VKPLSAENIWALVSGLPPGKRERRKLVALQAFIDDTGSEPTAPMFTLAGLVLSVQGWSDFSASWQSVLDAAPRLSFFKSNHAYGLKGQFAGWDDADRDRKVAALVDVILQFKPERYTVSVGNTDYESLMGDIPARNRFPQLSTPYFWLFYDFVVVSCTFQATLHKQEPPFYFIFDDQGRIGNETRDWWPTFRSAQHRDNPWLRPYIGDEPIFRSDRDCLPLQAADLVAGQMRRRFIGASLTDVQQALIRLPGDDRICKPEFLRMMRDSFLRTAEEIEAREPGSLTRVVGPRPRKRDDDDA
jgi:hypothetical protein